MTSSRWPPYIYRVLGIAQSECSDTHSCIIIQFFCHCSLVASVNAKGGTFRASGRGTIWLDEMGCSGTESTLESCRHPRWGHNDCSHAEDAGVICIAGEY
jgi:hypothetical protein